MFCGIVAGSIPSDQVRETGQTLAFRDVSPQAPVHVLVVPKDHYADAAEVAAAAPDLLRLLLEECVSVAGAEGVAESGYRIILNTGEQGGQAVAHCHAHVLGGRQLVDQLG